MSNDDVFDFLINEEDEVMLLLNVREGEPKNAHVEVNKAEKSMVLHRNETDSVILTDISADIFDSLQDADELMVCELSRGASDNLDAQIVYAYEAEISY